MNFETRHLKKKDNQLRHAYAFFLEDSDVNENFVWTFYYFFLKSPDTTFVVYDDETLRAAYELNIINYIYSRCSKWILLLRIWWFLLDCWYWLYGICSHFYPDMIELQLHPFEYDMIIINLVRIKSLSHEWIRRKQ